jgi:hypothetical protein
LKQKFPRRENIGTLEERWKAEIGQEVLDITFLDETYGTIVVVKQKDGMYDLPLCDLKATDADVEIRQLVEDYAVWFANR